MGKVGGGIAFVPRRGPAVRPRTRLLDRLEQLDAHPIVVLRAPAGGGKSTALAAWARNSKRTGVWVTLDPSAGERLGFWLRVTTTIRDSLAAPEHTPLHDLVIGTELRDRLRPALLRALAGLPDGFVVAIDDYHLVVDEQVHDDIAWLIEAGAPIDVRIATRSTTPFEQPEQVTRLATRVVAASELAFDRDETRAAGTEAGLDPSGADLLHDAFDGWPLAIQTALVERAAHPTADPRETLERIRTHGLEELLIEAIESDYLLFLLRTSVPWRLSPELAEELGGSDAPEYLRRAEHDGFGTWHDRPRAEFAYQPHLRRHLVGELERRMPTDAITVRAAYAHDRLRNGDGIEAFRQFAAIGDWDGATLAVRAHFADLQWHSGEVAALLRSAPPTTLRRHPVLLAVSAIMEYAQPETPRTRLLHLASLGTAVLQARLGLGDPLDRVVLLLALLGTQRVGGQYDQAVATTERLLTTLSSLDDAQSRQLAGIIARLWPHVATTLLYDGQLWRAVEFADRGAAAATVLDRSWSAVQSEGLRLYALAELGDHRELRPLLRQAAQRTRPDGWQGTYPGAGYHFAVAFDALERFDSRAARTELDALAVHEPTIEHWPIIARLRSVAALVEGDPLAGLATLERDIARHDDRPPTSRTMVALLAAARADLLLAAGETFRARAAVRGVRRGPEVDLASARIALALGRAEQAIAAASGAAWETASSLRTRSEAFLVIALAAARVGRADEARDAAQRAAGLLESGDLRRPLMMLPRADLEPLLHAVGAAHLLGGVPDVTPRSVLVEALTPAEHRALEALGEVGRIDDLAERLYLSPNTVKVHLRNVYRKLGVSSREEALAVGHLRGLLDRRDPD
jgi:LuxR family maltose regulon positive regulatory protein